MLDKELQLLRQIPFDAKAYMEFLATDPVWQRQLAEMLAQRLTPEQNAQLKAVFSEARRIQVERYIKATHSLEH